MNMYVKLMSDIFLVEGKKENLLYDLGRNDFYEINSSLTELIANQIDKPLEQIYAQFDPSMKDELSKLLDELHSMDLIFYTNTPTRFPGIDDVFHDSPTHIDNAIIEYSSSTTFNIHNVLDDLCLLNCKNIQLRFLDVVSIKLLENLFKHLSSSVIKGVEVFMPDHKRLSEPSLTKLISENKRIVRVNVYNSDKDQVVKYSENDHFGRLSYVSQSLEKGQEDIVNNKNYFIAMRTFFEARHRNLGLNKKVSISDQGEIKNYVSHSEVFGNVERDCLKEITTSESFQRKWFIKNDDIDICQSCAYRYACFNCSDIKETPEGFRRTRYCKQESILN